VTLQGQGFATVCLERAGVSTTGVERLVAVGAGRLLIEGCRAPIGGSTGQGHILKHARPDARPATIEFVFNLTERGFGMLQAPVAHPGHDLGGHPMPDLLVKGVAHRKTPVDNGE
jgi:hypothetical protein